MGFFAKLFGKKNKDKQKDTEKIKPIEDKKEQTPAPKPGKTAVITEEKAEIKKDPPKKEEKSEPKPQKADDAEAAESIVNDKTTETVKVKGLCGFFDIKKSKDGRYVFNLYASNKVIIATSQIYSSAQSALNGANSVIANAKKAGIEDLTLKNPTEIPFPKWEIYKDKAEQFRFRLYASNGNCICHSQGYTTKASCKNGIESIIRTVETAKIDKNYLTKK